MSTVVQCICDAHAIVRATIILMQTIQTEKSDETEIITTLQQ